MPLTDIEKQICKAVVSQFIAENKPTTRRALLKQFKEAVPEALNRLVDFTVLKGVANATDAFLPTSLAFRWCGDADVLRFAKHSVEVVLGTLRILFNHDLEQPEQPEHTPDDIEAQAKELKSQIEPQAIRIGLYLAGEFGVFGTIRSDPEYTQIVALRIGERILTIGDIEKAWDNHIQQWGQRLERESAAVVENPARAPQSEGLSSSNVQAATEARSEAASKEARTQSTLLPSVYISYAIEDSAWRERIAAHLAGAGFYVPDDPRSEKSGTYQSVLRPIREQARVFVLLVSPHYLGSDQIREMELPHIRPLAQTRARKIITVILAPCPWQSFLDLPKDFVLPDRGSRTLSTEDDERVEDDLGTLAQEVRRAIQETSSEPPPLSSAAPASKSLSWIEQKTIDRFSPSTRTTLARANQLRNEDKRRRIHIEHLLIALSEQPQSQLQNFLEQSKLDLLSLLSPELGYSDAPQPDEGPHEIEGLPPVSANVRRALISGRDRADADHSETILPSHLLFGVLSITENASVRILNSHGIVTDRIKLPTRLSADLGAESLLAGYQSDDPSGPDLLDITKEVEALASVLAAKDVDPPLSLGLFGDWGTGKSFFMKQLEARIKQLQEDANLADGASAYCRSIVQITFNAWNYIDCNLWASLTAEIFENLAAAIAQTRGEDSPEQRALVLAAASSSQAVLAEAEKKRTEAEQELKQTEEKLAALQKSEAELESNLDPSEILKQALRFAMQDDQVQKDLDGATRALHIPHAVAAANEVRSEIVELQGTGHAIILTLKNKKYLWVWFVVLGLALGAGWLVPQLILKSSLTLVVTRAIALLTAISVFLRPVVKASRQAMRLVESANASRQALIEKKRKEQTDKLKAEQTQIQQKVDAARKDVHDASVRSKALNDQLEKMRADRGMADYIRQRHQSADYTQHLGIISRVRADLRHLSTLLRAVKEESERDTFEAEMKARQTEKDRERENAGKHPLFPRIDRIVLYIDDLDRCPEKNVVEVLQAVHLLLAFPLFVVVVGVDPRWLLRSLQQYSRAFQTEENENDEGKKWEEEGHWQSTPLNYLEKIFQIPFSLRPINKLGFSRLVDAYAKSLAKPQATGDGHPAIAEPVPVPPLLEISGSVDLPDAAPLKTSIAEAPAAFTPPQELTVNPSTPKPPSLPPKPPASPPPIDRHPEHLQFREWEQAFMKELHEFIPTPRAGKRFINIYRLLRASLEENERPAFVGNEKSGIYRAAMLLLAILTGYPAEATEILTALIEEQPSSTWWEFIASFKARTLPEAYATQGSKSAPPWKKSALAALSESQAVTACSKRALGPEQLSWVELFEKLDRLKESMSDRSCRPFCDWAPRVARYSFQSGRVLLNLQK